jgi:tetratricopeptide (TPR) repeat protein
MKKTIVLLLSMIASFGFAQKKELKKAEKLFTSGDIEGASALLSSNAALFDTADEKVMGGYTFLKGKIAQQNKEFKTAMDIYMGLKENSRLKTDVAKQLQELLTDIVTSAIEDNNGEDYVASAEKLYMAYQIDPENGKDYLYFAASNSVNAKAYDRALELYFILKDIQYTGITTTYLVTEVATNNEIEVSEMEYGIYKKSKDYTNPKEVESESKYPEIVKNIALIYAQQGENENAIAAVQEARKSNPEDLNLILTEANLYIELDEKEKFKELISQAIEKDPNNANLYFNLGVVNNDLGDRDVARGFYEKAIALDPNFEAAYLNLVALILEGEVAMVEEMNSLGTSRKDDARHKVLRSERDALYKECVPILKGLIAFSNSQEAIKTLMNIYATLGENQGYKEMRALLEN